MNSGSKTLIRVLLATIVGSLSFSAMATTSQAAVKKPVSVYPMPGTPVASDKTTISFRGLKPKNLGPIKVYGGKSGRHGGKRLVHSDGNGVSFIPKRSFTPGEKVKVYTKKRIKRTNKGDFAFRIGRFYGNDDKKGKPGEPNKFPKLKSRPDLKPPNMKVETLTDEASPGKIFVAPRQDGMVITDNFGRISYLQQAGHGGKGDSILNFQNQTYEGKPVLTYWKGASSTTGFSQIGTFEILNRKYNRIARFQPGNGYKADIHEFAITPRNTALVLAYRGVLWNSTSVGLGKNAKILDNVIQEIDIKTGAVLFEWHSLGNVGLKSSAGETPDDGSPYDYFHANSIKMDGDSYLISARRQSTIYRVDRKTARIRWALRGDGRKGSFKMGPGTSFGYQHDAQRLPNGNISLFDNGSGRGVPEVNPTSSGLVLKLQGKGKNRSASLVKRYSHPDGIVSGSQGNMDTNGDNHLVGWGSEAQLTEFNAAGDVVLDMTFYDAPSSSYRAYKGNWVGIPKGRPAIASEAVGEGATVYASWNGSQSIAEWKVFSGAGAGSLSEVGSAPWANLETAIDVASIGARVQVQAFDREGKKIGQSKVVAVGTQSR